MAASLRIQACGRGEDAGVSELREGEDSCHFPTAQQFLRFTEDGEKKRKKKNPAGARRVQKNALTSDVIMGRLVGDHREAAGTQITTGCNGGLQNTRRPAEPV